MTYIIAFTVILIIYFLLRYPKNIYSFLISLELLAINMLLITNLVYMLRTNQYDYNLYTQIPFWGIIKKMPLSIYDTRIVLHMAMMFFIVTSAVLYAHNIKKDSKYAVKLIFLGCYVIITGFNHLYLNSPAVVETLYIQRHISSNTWPVTVIRFTEFFNICTLVFCLFPSLQLFINTRQSRIIFKRRHLSLLFFIHTTLFGAFMVILLSMPSKKLLDNYHLHDFTMKNNSNVFSLLTFTIILLFFSIFVMLVFNFNSLNEKVFNAKRQNSKTSVILISDIRHVFHSYKNSLFTIRLLAEKALSAPGTETATIALQDICQNVDDFLTKANRFLGTYNNLSPNFDTVDVKDCVDQACQRIVIPDTITIEKHYQDDQLSFFGDVDLMTEAFVNLLSNAVESIERSHKPNGKITVSIWCEKPWICVDILDNGLGISKNLQTKIFDLLYSTKQTINNWGIGLSYVKNICLAHSGYIHLKSRKNSYAEFQITLLQE